MSFNKVEKTLEVFQIASRGLGYNNDSDGFIISNRNIQMNLLMLPDTLTPVLAGMSDMLYSSLFPDEDFKGLFPTQIEKREKALCFAVLRDNDNYKIENSGYSLTTAHLMSSYIMENVLMANKHGKVELSNLINLWRTELGSYKEGEIIDLNKHKKNLIDFNMTLYPKIRDDLLEQRKSNIGKNIFK